MTQDTNNQEWWEEEFKELMSQSYVYDPDCETLSISPIIAFIRKVSQKSREDALKECVETVNEVYEKAMADFGNQDYGSPDLNMNGAIQVSAIQMCLFALKSKT